MKAIFQENIQKGNVILPELDAHKVCEAFGIDCPPTKLVTTREACVEAGNQMGYPVVIKIFSKQIIHKSDAGGVIVGIQNAEALSESYDCMMQTVAERCPDAIIEGVVIQKMMSKGIEVVVGALKNEQFGPVIMFGMGGIYIEVFKDVAFRLAPITVDEAKRMIEETKIYELLKGVRGEKASDIDALAAMLVNVGKLIATHDEIREIDFNPIICYPDGCVAVDARFVLNTQ
ncbi:acetate--CoA ligase family protein [Fusibacter paucivorans]|uniref:Acetate--CoA ligase family protein n=1 Tax=Fusibacter paucivorans TaxID=76009 RepID=A0ABS5PLX5_9FIRM|nr:acetate--CoA ligase family protein [Fusibacter paucivorans]MBS7526178.1 acetate--CoA ligase family protein [Fusibacter paucivorans]